MGKRGGKESRNKFSHLVRLWSIRNMLVRLVSSLFKSLTNKISSRKCGKDSCRGESGSFIRWGTEERWKKAKLFSAREENSSACSERFLRFLRRDFIFHLWIWEFQFPLLETASKEEEDFHFSLHYLWHNHLLLQWERKNVENFWKFLFVCAKNVFMVPFPIRKMWDGSRIMENLFIILFVVCLEFARAFLSEAVTKVEVKQKAKLRFGKFQILSLANDFVGFLGELNWDKIFTFCFWCGKRLFPFSRINYPLSLSIWMEH